REPSRLSYQVPESEACPHSRGGARRLGGGHAGSRGPASRIQVKGSSGLNEVASACPRYLRRRRGMTSSGRGRASRGAPPLISVFDGPTIRLFARGPTPDSSSSVSLPTGTMVDITG